MLGVGVMINELAGRRGGEHLGAAIGKEISSLSASDDVLRISFTDGTGIDFRDEGQSCCEHRYMTCDDDLPVFIGATLTDAELRDGPDEPAEYGDNEIQFLIITTSKGAFTVASHNEHNGYYGGFYITIRPVTH